MASKQAPLASEEPEVRIVLLGKTGTGKSKVGNTILRKDLFESRPSIRSVTSECEKKSGTFDQCKLTVIDTPGLFNTKKTDKETLKEIAKCISMAAPGPHVFLVVLQVTRFTKEEKDTFRMIQAMFGKEASKYTIALFTHGDQLEQLGTRDPIEGLIEQNEDLSDFIEKCQGGYHVFNNLDKNPAQVRELLQKMNKMIEENEESHYTDEMFSEAEKANRLVMEKPLEINPNVIPKVTRQEAEKDKSFILTIVAGAAAGAVAGAAVGMDVRPVGAAVGAGVGAATGVWVAVALLKKFCYVQ